MLRKQQIIIDLGDAAVYWDFDGVLANYAKGMRRLGYHVDEGLRRTLLKRDTGHPLKREMYEKIKGTDFFRYLEAMPGSVEMYQAIKTASPSLFLTASPLFGATEDDYFLNPYWLGAAYHKRLWLEHVFLPQAYPRHDVAFGMPRTHYSDRIAVADERFICTTSLRKHQFIGRRHSTKQILVDDRIENIEAWVKAGGMGILHLDPQTTLHAFALLAGADFGLTSPGEWKRFGDKGGYIFDPRVEE